MSVTGGVRIYAAQDPERRSPGKRRRAGLRSRGDTAYVLFSSS